MDSRNCGHCGKARDLQEVSLAALSAKAGVTRVADLTGLDRLDIPVVQAVRPMGKSLSTTMGKGMDLDAAITGAIMEAVEVYCAEELPLPCVDCFAAETGNSENRAQIRSHRSQCRCGMWLAAQDIVSGQVVPVPFHSISLDYTRGEHFPYTDSNGLASGRTIAGALCHAILELAERDRMAKWMRSSPAQKSETKVQLETIESNGCREIFLKIKGGGCRLLLWDMSGSYSIPVFGAAIVDRYRFDDFLPPAFGAAARRDPAGAVIAAVGEAAQTRAALISGTRDDFGQEYYHAPHDSHAKILLETLAFLPAARAFVDAAVTGGADADSDLAWLIDTLTAGGVGQLLWVDLYREDIGMPVVKAIASSLEGYQTDLTAWQRAP